MRTAIYLRVSEDKTGDEAAVSRQGEDALALIESRGWTLAGTYTDNDLSARGRVKRPEFIRLVSDINAGRVDVVIAWTWDRLTRSPRDRLAFIEAAQQHRVIVSLVRGSDLDMSTPAGRLNAGILAEMAQHEIDSKGDRQRRANEQRARNGLPPAGPVPFGFLPDRVAHHPQQATAISTAYRDVLSGTSLAEIARQWNAEGLLSGQSRTGAIKRGKPSEWRSETVRALMLKPRNAGLREYLGATYPGTWEPIVPVETFEAVRQLLTDPGRRQTPPAAKHLLSGVALCGVCGSPVNAGTGRPNYTAYRCRYSKAHVARKGDVVDE
ncbi:MAG TPA: recombinase family protein, partial [Pseudonocardia sp.]